MYAGRTNGIHAHYYDNQFVYACFFLYARVWLLGFECVAFFLPFCCLDWCRLVKIKEWVDERDPHATIIPFSASLELKV